MEITRQRNLWKFTILGRKSNVRIMIYRTWAPVIKKVHLLPKHQTSWNSKRSTLSIKCTEILHPALIFVVFIEPLNHILKWRQTTSAYKSANRNLKFILQIPKNPALYKQCVASPSCAKNFVRERNFVEKLQGRTTASQDNRLLNQRRYHSLKNLKLLEVIMKSIWFE